MDDNHKGKVKEMQELFFIDKFISFKTTYILCWVNSGVDVYTEPEKLLYEQI